MELLTSQVTAENSLFIKILTSLVLGADYSVKKESADFSKFYSIFCLKTFGVYKKEQLMFLKG